MTPKLLGFAGSTRTASFNKLLVRHAANVARSSGANVTLIDLRDFSMPIYDGDLEEESGIPQNALKLRELMKSHHGVILSCPEYNSAISAVLKNSIDWVSRPVPNEPSLAAFTGKTAAILAASPGALGGLRTLVSVRTILVNLGMIVIPKQYALARAFKSFDENGELQNEIAIARVSSVVQQMLQITSGVISENS